jgi:hypothetical protein
LYTVFRNFYFFLEKNCIFSLFYWKLGGVYCIQFVNCTGGRLLGEGRLLEEIRYTIFGVPTIYIQNPSMQTFPKFYLYRHFYVPTIYRIPQCKPCKTSTSIQYFMPPQVNLYGIPTIYIQNPWMQTLPKFYLYTALYVPTIESI